MILTETTEQGDFTAFAKYLLSALVFGRSEIVSPILIFGDASWQPQHKIFFHCSPKSLAVMSIFLNVTSAVRFFSFFNLTSGITSERTGILLRFPRDMFPLPSRGNNHGCLIWRFVSLFNNGELPTPRTSFCGQARGD